MKEVFFTLQECADYGKVTRQAVYLAIKKKKIKAEKVGREWKIKREDYDFYRCNKFNRDLLKYDGDYVFDMDKGDFSVQQVSKIISCTLKVAFPCYQIYYLIRSGRLRAFRRGTAWVIKKEDAVELLEKRIRLNEQQLALC